MGNVALWVVASAVVALSERIAFSLLYFSATHEEGLCSSLAAVSSIFITFSTPAVATRWTAAPPRFPKGSSCNPRKTRQTSRKLAFPDFTANKSAIYFLPTTGSIGVKALSLIQAGTIVAMPIIPWEANFSVIFANLFSTFLRPNQTAACTQPRPSPARHKGWWWCSYWWRNNLF